MLALHTHADTQTHTHTQTQTDTDTDTDIGGCGSPHEASAPNPCWKRGCGLVCVSTPWLEGVAWWKDGGSRGWLYILLLSPRNLRMASKTGSVGGVASPVKHPGKRYTSEIFTPSDHMIMCMSLYGLSQD
jgi:hypothetical protein